MTFTWNLAATTDLQKVRFLIQDKDSAHALLQDEEIQYFISVSGSNQEAAALACEAIAAQFSRYPDRSAFSVSDSPGSIVDHYLAMAARFRREAKRSCEIFAGGRTISGKRDLATDADKVQPDFGVGMDDYSHHQGFSGGKYEDND